MDVDVTAYQIADTQAYARTRYAPARLSKAWLGELRAATPGELLFAPRLAAILTTSGVCEYCGRVLVYGRPFRGLTSREQGYVAALARRGYLRVVRRDDAALGQPAEYHYVVSWCGPS